MVHLASVPNDEALNVPLVPGLEQVKRQEPGDDETIASIFGTRFANQELPRHEMPDREMPREVAYRMIKDELSLDGNPILNLASFVTTFMVGFFFFLFLSSFPVSLVSGIANI